MRGLLTLSTKAVNSVIHHKALSERKKDKKDAKDNDAVD